MTDAITSLNKSVVGSPQFPIDLLAQINTALAAIQPLSVTEAAYLDGVTAGTIAASKAVVVDANKDAGDFRNLDCVNLDAGASGAAGTVDIYPATASKGKLAVTCADQTGNTTVTLTADAMGQATTVHIGDFGAAAAFLVQAAANTKFAYGTLTLAANAATTTIANTSITANTRVILTPTSANAAADVGSATGVYVSAKNAGASIVITHPNNANADKTFDYMIVL